MPQGLVGSVWRSNCGDCGALGGRKECPVESENL